MNNEDFDSEKYIKYMDNLLEKFKKDPLYEQKRELGELLMINKNDFTEEQEDRYYELINIIRE